MSSGIKFGENYRIETLDELNVVVKKFSPSKETINPRTREKVVSKERWDTISYHANVNQAIKSIANKEINVVVDDGIQAVIDKVNELESIIDKIEIISFED